MMAPYAAHGLRLTCSFELPGLDREAAPARHRPSLQLTVNSEATLQRAWSGALGTPQWRGQLGDGQELILELGSTGDRLFSYGDRARFRLDASLCHLECAPRSRGLDWQRVLIGKVLPSASVMRGYEALHAAVIDTPDGVVAMMGAAGAGKSTLAAELMSRGWPLFADDQLTLGRLDGEVCAHPGTRHLTLAESAGEFLDLDALGDTLAVTQGERWLIADAFTAVARPVRMLCLLERRAGSELELHTLPSSPLAVAPHVLGLAADAERERARFALYADLVQSTTLVRLAASVDDPPHRLGDLVEQALEPCAQGVPGAAL